MDQETIKDLIEYHLEFNERLFNYCNESISEVQFVEEFEYSHSSIRNLFVHMLDVDNRWLSGLLGENPPSYPNPSDYPSFSTVHERWYAVNHQLRDYVKHLTDSELNKPFVEHMKVWQVLFHIVNHGTHHRAQVYSLLKRFGIKARPQDYALYRLGRI